IKELVEGLINANHVIHNYPIEVVSISDGQIYETNTFSITVVKALHKARALSFIWKENDRPGTMITEKLDELGIPRGPLVGKLQRGISIELDGKIIHSKDVQGPVKKGRIIVYSGDTYPNPNLIEHIPGKCTILIHEGTYGSGDEQLAKERGHSTIDSVAKLATTGNVEKLVITHISARITNLKEELMNAKQIFNNIVFAKDGMNITL
ncbi:MAG: ribonuclease Z, partial [Candidatus Heimdallarchaeota archaeon]|nr:ribonuclease Z [Candidatus Heimdallarchaeota archaeon]